MTTICTENPMLFLTFPGEAMKKAESEEERPWDEQEYLLREQIKRKAFPVADPGIVDCQYVTYPKQVFPRPISTPWEREIPEDEGKKKKKPAGPYQKEGRVCVEKLQDFVLSFCGLVRELLRPEAA